MNLIIIFYFFYKSLYNTEAHLENRSSNYKLRACLNFKEKDLKDKK